MKWFPIDVPRRRWRLCFLIAGILISLLVFEDVVDDVFSDPHEGDLQAHHFDQSIREALRPWRTNFINQAMTDLTALGSFSLIMVLFLIFTVVLWTYRDYRGISFLTLLLLGAGGWPAFLKPIFQRERPDVDTHLVQVTDLSFPSGHSFAAAALYIGYAYYAARITRAVWQELAFYALALFVINLVAFSRIFLGVHYPTDVLGGLSAGFAWGFTVCAIFEAHSPTLRKAF